MMFWLSPTRCLLTCRLFVKSRVHKPQDAVVDVVPDVLPDAVLNAVLDADWSSGVVQSRHPNLLLVPQPISPDVAPDLVPDTVQDAD